MCCLVVDNLKMDPFGPPPPIPPSYSGASAIPAPAFRAALPTGPLDQATLRRVLNERFLLSRRVEREGMRRIFIACMMFVGIKFLKSKFVGKREDTSF